MSTIYNVAEVAGVSPATVSRMLNNSGYVSSKARKAINRAICELGYEPNILAQSLVTKTTYTIGLIIPDITNPSYSPTVRAVQDVAMEAGYVAITCNSDGSRQGVVEISKRLQMGRVDGFIIHMLEGRENKALEEYIGQLVQKKVPVVVIGPVFDDELCVDCLGVDDVEGAFQAVSHLIDLGHVRIGAITGADNTVSTRRLHGYVRALNSQFIDIDDFLIIDGDFKIESGFAAMQKFLNMQSPPSAVFAFNDMMAIGAVEAIERADKVVPDDFAIVGFDDNLLASIVRPKLTTVMVPQYEIGRKAAEVLLARINGEQCEKKNTMVFRPRLVVRDSSVSMKCV
jgi:LacI family transcriptional regulator